MIPEPTLHPEASRELAEAATFYEVRVPGLGERFLGSFERAKNQIRIFPAAAPLVGDTVRQRTLDRFPYSVFYLFENDRIFLVAIAHHKRQPLYWKKRLRE